MSVRSTQIVIEVVSIPNPKAHVTQLVAEAAVTANPKARVTQLITEAAVTTNPLARVTQLVTEVAYPNPGFAISPGNPTYQAVVLAEPSLVSYWQLNEASGATATDTTDGNGGTYTGGFTLNQPGFRSSGPAVLLNGSTGYVSIPDATNLHLSSGITLEAIIKSSSASNFAGIISKYDPATSNFGYAIAPVSNTLGVWCGSGTWITGVKNIIDNNWHHVAATITSGGAINIYVDGHLDNTGQQTPNVSNTHALYIGRDGTGTLYFNGLISNAAVYNTVLPAVNILNHSSVI